MRADIEYLRVPRIKRSRTHVMRCNGIRRLDLSGLLVFGFFVVVKLAVMAGGWVFVEASVDGTDLAGGPPLKNRP